MKKLTTQIYEEYGFVKKGKFYYLDLEDVVICSGFSSMYGIPYLAYNFSIKAIHPEEERKPNNMFDGYDSFENKICFNTKAPGTHCCEIEFESWEQDYYADILRKSLHYYFDPYKKDALNHIRRIYKEVGLVYMGTTITVSKVAKKYLGIDSFSGDVKAGNFKITGTFKYGKLLGMGLFVAFNILLGIGVLFSLGVILFAPIDNYSVYIIVLAVGLVVWGLWIWLSSIQLLHRKKIKLWMEDAVLVEGMMTKTADMPGSIREHIYRIAVKYEKKKITLDPRSFYTKRSVGLMAVHYYNKYLDRNIYVLYSPKYNQVIFIEQPQRMDEIS